MFRSQLLLLAAATLAACDPRPAPLPSATRDTLVTMPDGARLRVRTYGNAAGTPVVVLHGGPTMGSEYLAQTIGPIAEGRTFVLVDQRGRGGSPDGPPPSSWTFAQDVNDLRAVVEQLGVAKVALWGDHYGAAIAAAFAAADSTRVERLLVTTPMYLDTQMMMAMAIAVGDTARLRSQGNAMRANADTIATRGYCEEFWGMTLSPLQVADSAVVRTLGPFVCGQSATRLKTMASDRSMPIETLLAHPLRADLERVRVPTLVVTGLSNTTMFALSAEWVKSLPNARLLSVEGWPQFPWVQGSAQAMPALRTFLAGEWPTQAKIKPPADTTS